MSPAADVDPRTPHSDRPDARTAAGRAESAPAPAPDGPSVVQRRPVSPESSPVSPERPASREQNPLRAETPGAALQGDATPAPAAGSRGPERSVSAHAPPAEDGEPHLAETRPGTPVPGARETRPTAISRPAGDTPSGAHAGSPHVGGVRAGEPVVASDRAARTAEEPAGTRVPAFSPDAPAPQAPETRGEAARVAGAAEAPVTVAEAGSRPSPASAPRGQERRPSVAPAEMAERIARLAAEARPRERREITLRLDPPALGEVRVRVEAAGQEIRVHIVTETREASFVLAEGRGQLREELQRQGLSLHSFSASSSAEPGTGSGTGQGGHAAHHRGDAPRQQPGSGLSPWTPPLAEAPAAPVQRSRGAGALDARA